MLLIDGVIDKNNDNIQEIIDNELEEIDELEFDFADADGSDAEEKDAKGNIKEGLAFNDVSMIRNSPRIAKIKVKVNNKTRIDDFLGDGCLISTPAGSSAYNLSLRGPVIPVGTDVLALTPISPYRPRRWRGALLNNNAKITLLSLDYKTRPVRAEADFMEFKNITKLEIELEKKKFMNVLFDPGHDMEERIITEQFNN